MKSPVVKHYPVIIIGGGIVGSGIFRELCLHGINTLLVEKGDFNSQTSQCSSKMLHGGIRYLENYDFALVQEALEEKNLWLKLAPHLCYETPFHLPNYNDSKYPLPMLKLGLFAYDLLSHFQNKASYTINAQETIQLFPEIKRTDLRGSAVYYDGIVDDAKLGLECIYDGLHHEGSQALNYTELIKCHRTSPQEYLLTLKDTLTNKTWDASCNELIFATGPFTDILIKKLNFIPWTPKLAPSKGIHLWIRPEDFNITKPAVIQTKDNRVIFIIPQRDAILVGTTETPLNEEMFNIQPHQNEIAYLLANLKEFFPSARLEAASVLGSFAGVRPLVLDNPQNGLGKISRHHKVLRPHSNLQVIIGGKYTTFRRMAQDVNKVVIPRLGIAYRPHLTLAKLRQKSNIPTFTSFKLTEEVAQKILKMELVKTKQDFFERRLSLLSKIDKIDMQYWTTWLDHNLTNDKTIL